MTPEELARFNRKAKESLPRSKTKNVAPIGRRLMILGLGACIMAASCVGGGYVVRHIRQEAEAKRNATEATQQKERETSTSEIQEQQAQEQRRQNWLEAQRIRVAQEKKEAAEAQARRDLYDKRVAYN